MRKSHNSGLSLKASQDSNTTLPHCDSQADNIQIPKLDDKKVILILMIIILAMAGFSIGLGMAIDKVIDKYNNCTMQAQKEPISFSPIQQPLIPLNHERL